MLIFFPLPLGYEINLLQSILERKVITYKDFIDSKWSAAYNLFSEILRRQIPFSVLECQYGLGSDELRKAIKEYMKNIPIFHNATKDIENCVYRFYAISSVTSFYVITFDVTTSNYSM